MENTLQIKDPKKLKYTFDLKGSTAGRITTGLIKPSTVQKDLNFLQKSQSIPKIRTNELMLRRVISRDAAFLMEMGLIDYSLLLAVESKKNKSAEQR